MPDLTEHKSRHTNRILLVGDPGSGKTTAVGHLLEHGQTLFVADFDDGLDPIRRFVDPKFHKNLHYETLVDKIIYDPSTAFPKTEGRPKAFPKFIKLMGSWVDSGTGEDFGPPESWNENTWLIIDPLTSLGNAAMLFTLDKAGRAGMLKRKKDWGDAIARVEGVIMQMRSLPINVIMLAHLVRLTPDEPDPEDDDDTKRKKRKLPDNYMMRYPSVLGQKLPPKVGGYFNTILQTARVGSGPRATRVIQVTPSEDVDVKIPAPMGKKPDYPITGLWDIIQTIRSS